ncbi:helix-turn-helix domain-containing protein [Comamonadaceae bacterium OH2310_COT-174]|nr:helix-turn-helix domain-containing protein [Comamonadaceae bacterium OH2310_COT-174]
MSVGLSMSDYESARTAASADDAAADETAMAAAQDEAQLDGQAMPGLNKPSIESFKTPGGLLAYYRMEREVSLPELAAVLKVPVDKLQALERDDYAMLPDMVFTRALALSICRLLGADAQPVMALFPSAHAPRLARDSDGLNRAFKATEQPALGGERKPPSAGIPRSAWVLGVLLLLAALAVFFWPQIQQRLGWATSGEASGMSEAADAPSTADGLRSQPLHIPGLNAGAGAEPRSAQAPEEPEDKPDEEDSSASAAPAGPGQAGADTAAGQASSAAAPATANAAAGAGEATAAAAPAHTLHIQAQESVWIQIRDASNAILHQSTLPKGREIAITNEPPLRVEIGRADAVKVTVKGQPFDLQPFARGNVARFEVSP